VHFSWQSSHSSAGGPCSYRFHLYTQFHDIIDTVTADTELVHEIPIPVFDTRVPHFWEVIANDGFHERQSSNGIGMFYINYDAANEPHGPLPQTLTLNSYPNPFNAQTTISFSLPIAGAAELRIFDVLGREVYAHSYPFLNQGPHSVGFNGMDLPSGLYMARLQTSNAVRTVKLTLLK
jgi:hypothetical protein